MATELQQLIETKHSSPEEIASRTREIYDSVLRPSDYFDGGNFAAIHPNDIEQLFDLYDGQFCFGHRPPLRYFSLFAFESRDQQP